MSAEYILSEGNPNVVLCERGVRSFDLANWKPEGLDSVCGGRALCGHWPRLRASGGRLRYGITRQHYQPIGAGCDSEPGTQTLRHPQAAENLPTAQELHLHMSVGRTARGISRERFGPVSSVP